MERTIRNYLCRYRDEGAMGLLFGRKKKFLPRIAAVFFLYGKIILLIQKD